MTYVDIPPDKKFGIIREMTQRDNNLLSISALCKIAGVSRSGYYRWLDGEPKREGRERKDKEDFELVLKAYQYRGYAKGVRSIYAAAPQGSDSGHKYQEDSASHDQI